MLAPRPFELPTDLLRDVKAIRGRLGLTQAQLAEASGCLVRRPSPAEPHWVDLIARPKREGLATLLLIDEVLLYARDKVGVQPEWRSRLVKLFQYLTQAAVKVDGCAIVASLLASDPSKEDEIGNTGLNTMLWDAGDAQLYGEGLGVPRNHKIPKQINALVRKAGEPHRTDCSCGG